MQTHWSRTKIVLSNGEKLMAQVPSGTAAELKERIESLQQRWEQLRDIAQLVAKWLKEAQQAAQYFQVSIMPFW